MQVLKHYCLFLLFLQEDKNYHLRTNWRSYFCIFYTPIRNKCT